MGKHYALDGTGTIHIEGAPSSFVTKVSELYVGLTDAEREAMEVTFGFNVRPIEED